MTEVRLLLATVPWRRAACQFLLDCLPRQTRVPDAVTFVLDGYGDAPAPLPPAPLDRVTRERRTAQPLGPGGRYRALEDVDPETVVVVLDDDLDVSNAPDLVAKLVDPVLRENVATSTSGFAVNGAMLTWDSRHEPAGGYDGSLVALCSNGMAARASALVGLGEGLKLDFDPMGLGGDDEAVVSAHLWSHGVRMLHVQVDGLRIVDGTQEKSQSAARAKVERAWDWQRRALRAATGWPWPEPQPSFLPMRRANENRARYFTP